MQTIALNGTPIEALGLILTNGGPEIAGLNRQRAFVAMPGRAGGLLSPYSTIEPRVLRFELATGSSITTNAQRYALLDQFRDLADGAVEVTFNTGIARKIVGVCRVFEGVASRPSFVGVHSTIVLEIQCENAAFMDNEPSQLVLSTTPARVLVGTVGHAGRFYVTGPNTTAFTITYRSHDGQEWGLLDITPDLATGERCIIDLASQQIVHVDSADVRTLVPEWDNGSSWFHVLPRDGVRELSLWPTLESSVSALYEYRRNWEH